MQMLCMPDDSTGEKRWGVLEWDEREPHSNALQMQSKGAVTLV